MSSIEANGTLPFPSHLNASSIARILNALIVLALLAHVTVLLMVSNRARSPWSGGGDASIYENLARNVARGEGYTFGGTPTAFRAPLYPLFVAALMRAAPAHWPLELRAIQTCFILCAAFLAGQLTKKWCGEWRLGVLFALVMPTLLFFQTEVLTESLAALIVIAWWYCLSESFAEKGTRAALLAGACAGAASLERFNAIPLVIIAPVFLLLSGYKRRAALALAASCVIIAPWLAHNWVSFGTPLYSTHTGFALVEGVLSPTGRGDPDEIASLREKLGWFNGDVESNQAPPDLRNERALNAQALRLGWRLWSDLGFSGSAKLLGIKLGAFWFSSDQLFSTSSFASGVRRLRQAGVALYLVLFVLAVAGWRRLLHDNPRAAWVIFGTAFLMTALHLPLSMNTRLRSPLFDPLLASLSAVGALSLIRDERARSVLIRKGRGREAVLAQVTAGNRVPGLSKAGNRELLSGGPG